jgi:hypothetical protein
MGKVTGRVFPESQPETLKKQKKQEQDDKDGDEDKTDQLDDT